VRRWKEVALFHFHHLVGLLRFNWIQKRRIRDCGLRYGKLGNSHAPVVPKAVNFFLLKLCPYLPVNLIINDIIESISFGNDFLDGESENDVLDGRQNDNTLVGGPAAVLSTVPLG
jgi:hypothetical protein